jgi:hypothetical protein
MTLPTSWDASLALISALILKSDTIEHEDTFQKLGYFLKRKCPKEFQKIWFYYHENGPTAAAIYEGLLFALKMDILRQQVFNESDGTTKTFFRAGGNRDELTTLDSLLSEEAQGYVAQLAIISKSYPWQALELASIIDHVWINKNKESIEEATKHALLLKRNYEAFREPALELLNQLQLLEPLPAQEPHTIAC